jgi:hypothetical protein
MSNLRLDHVPLLEGHRNYRERSQFVLYTLLGEGLWTYVSEGMDPLDVVNFGSLLPKALHLKSTEVEVTSARDFVVNDTKANAIIRRRLAPLISTNIPSAHQDSARDLETPERHVQSD